MLSWWWIVQQILHIPLKDAVYTHATTPIYIHTHTTVKDRDLKITICPATIVVYAKWITEGLNHLCTAQLRRREPPAGPCRLLHSYIAFKQSLIYNVDSHYDSSTTVHRVYSPNRRKPYSSCRRY